LVSERLRIEMELKLEKERRKKAAIEELMARELDHTVSSRSHKRRRDDRDRSHKRYRHDDDYRDNYDPYHSHDYPPYSDR